MSSKVETRHTRAAAKGAEIKRLQEEALTKLPLNTLYITLYIRNDPPIPNDFHWGFYFHTSPRGGIEYQVKGVGDGWIADHAFAGGIFKSNFLCILIQIATIPQAAHAQVDQILRSYEEDLNSIPGVTCRVWLLKMAQILTRDGLLTCENIEALQEECFGIGNQYMWEAAMARQPRPVVKASVCS